MISKLNPMMLTKTLANSSSRQLYWVVSFSLIMFLAFSFQSISWQYLVWKLLLLVLLMLKVVYSYPEATGLMLRPGQ